MAEEDVDGEPMEEDVGGEPMEEDAPAPVPPPAESKISQTDPVTVGGQRRRPRAVDMFADSDDDDN
jgi:U2-associated protein SR140